MWNWGISCCFCLFGVLGVIRREEEKRNKNMRENSRVGISSWHASLAFTLKNFSVMFRMQTNGCPTDGG